MAGVVDFQDEEQVKSFLENMEVECNYQCYREKNPDGERRQRSQGTRGDAWGRGRGRTGHERPLKGGLEGVSGRGLVGTRWDTDDLVCVGEGRVGFPEDLRASQPGYPRRDRAWRPGQVRRDALGCWGRGVGIRQ